MLKNLKTAFEKNDEVMFLKTVVKGMLGALFAFAGRISAPRSVSERGLATRNAWAQIFSVVAYCTATGKDRRTAASAMFEILALKTRDYIEVCDPTCLALFVRVCTHFSSSCGSALALH